MPSARDPERFHEEASEIAHALVAIAERITPSTVATRRQSVAAIVVDAKRKVTVNGREVVVQRPRLPFRIHHGR